MTSDPRWLLLERAEKRLLDTFSAQGVNRIRYVAAFPDLDRVGVWLCTESDAQRDSLRKNPKLRYKSDSLVVKPDVVETVQKVLKEAGFVSRQLLELSVVSQSQETVDRDCQGSWLYATR